ncbi:carbohydrate kinase family protein [Streptomyces sp. NBC_01716]|uniref:carbohydrate kinase family protein n=1 Tax=Streptomyces sp. NBC_01716 TaxID=2975917 RepID=UPI002E343A08|nr:carbohydrate kinase family protein [Streptomyces sp. NBC_01716]
MGEENPARITVLGDVNLEVTGVIAPRFGALTGDHLTSAPLKVHVGGTAANFAIAARAHFRRVRLVGVVGTDEQGSWAESALRSCGVDTRLFRSPGRPTGTVVAIRDGGTQQGSRLMIASPGSANSALTSDHIASNGDVLADTDFIVADGYSLLSEPRRSAVLEAMRRGSRAGAHVVLDLVPHHLETLISHEELRVWLTYASIVVCEAATARGLLGLPLPSGPLQLPAARETAEQLARAFPGRAFLLRFGFANIDQSLIRHPDGESTHHFTGFSEATDTYAFGDRLTAREIADHFTDHHRTAEQEERREDRPPQPTH